MTAVPNGLRIMFRRGAPQASRLRFAGRSPTYGFTVSTILIRRNVVTGNA